MNRICSFVTPFRLAQNLGRQSNTFHSIRPCTAKPVFAVPQIVHSLQLLLKSSQIPTKFAARPVSGSGINANTNLAKDIMIYKYENPKFFKYMNIFAYSQFLFWSYLSHFAYTELRDIPVDADKVDETTSWWEKMNLGDSKNRKIVAILCFSVGYAILGLAWMFTLRSVRMLVLRKGGNTITMIMYGPFGKNRIMDVPLNCISAQDSRQTAKVIMPLKLKGARMYYMLDMRGEFTNTKLFDHTVGLKRQF